MKYQCVGPLIGPVNGFAVKVTNKGSAETTNNVENSSCLYKNVQVTLQLQIPSSRNRDAFCSKVWYHDAFNCQRPLDSTVLTGEFKYRRVRTSKFLTRLTCRFLSGTLDFFNHCCGPTVWASLQLNLCCPRKIRTSYPSAKNLCVTITPVGNFYIVFNKTQVNKRQNLQ